MIEDPLDRIIDEIHDHMTENPARLPESLAETTTAVALLDIARSLRRTVAPAETPTELALTDGGNAGRYPKN